MRFSRGQGISRLRGAFGGPLARCAQLNLRPLGERPGAGRDEDLVRGAKLIAGIAAAALAAQPLTAEQVSASQLSAQAGASQVVDRLAVMILSDLIRGQQGARARLGPQRPVGAAGAGGLRERLQGVGRADRLPAPDRCFDQLRQDQGGQQLLRVLARLLGRGQRLLIPAEAVVQQRGRIVDESQRHPRAPAHRHRQAALDQCHGLGFVALPGGKLKGTKRMEAELARGGRLDDLLPFGYRRRSRREIARPGQRDGERVESVGQHDESAGITGQANLAGGQQSPALAIPENERSVIGEPSPRHGLHAGDVFAEQGLPITSSPSASAAAAAPSQIPSRPAARHTSTGSPTGSAAATSSNCLAAGGRASYRPISAHFNPATTLAFALRRDMDWIIAVVYWIVQFAAAACGSLLARVFFGPAGNLAATMPKPGQSWQAASFEAIITFGLVLMILNLANGPKLNGPFVPLAVGAYIMAWGTMGGPFDGASMNPARSFGPDLALGNLSTWWLYLTGPVAGAVIAVGVAHVLRGPAKAQEASAAQGTPIDRDA